MISIKCIAIDDEPPALEQIKKYILNVPYLQLLDVFDNAIDAMGYIKENKVDLIFLDIQMEHLSGIQFLKLLKEQPKIILSTAYDSYALEAFDLEVDDYLLKPISFERFLKSTEKIYKQFELEHLGKTENSNLPISIDRDYFFVKTEFRIQRVEFNDILYIQGLKEYLIIQTPVEKIYTLQKFSEILEKLPSSNFVRVHKSYIVALDKIDSVRKKIILIGEKHIPIGATYKEAFFKLISD